jgi:hypothetical protein
MIRLAAQEAVDAELESRIHASQARKARLSSFFTSLGAPNSGPTATPGHPTPTLTATTVTPEPTSASPVADVSSPIGRGDMGETQMTHMIKSTPNLFPINLTTGMMMRIMMVYSLWRLLLKRN